MPDVHATAVVDPAAELDGDVVVEAHAVVGAGVRLGPGVRVGPFSIVEGPTVVGEGCVLTSHVALGTAPQDLKHRGEPTTLSVGGRNTFREFVTVNRGTVPGGGETVVGHGNLFMTGSHVAHDCRVGSDTIFANNATLGGHVEVLDGATIGAFSAVHQFCRVGRRAFVGGFTVVTKDVLPFMKTVGARGHVKAFGPNRIGLERKGMPPEVIDLLAAAFRTLRTPRGRSAEGLDALAAEHGAVEEVAELIAFARAARESRGFHA